MKSISTPLVAVVAVAVLLGGCGSTQQTGQKQTLGAVTGAVLGGVLGSQVGKGSGRLWATGAGVLLGAVVGSELGKSLDDNDRAMMERTNQASLEQASSGAKASWRNPDTGHSGTITPTRTFQQADGTYCREFTQSIVVGGQTQEGVGTACRQPDGSWRIIQ